MVTYPAPLRLGDVGKRKREQSVVPQGEDRAAEGAQCSLATARAGVHNAIAIEHDQLGGQLAHGRRAALGEGEGEGADEKGKRVS